MLEPLSHDVQGTLQETSVSTSVIAAETRAKPLSLTMRAPDAESRAALHKLRGHATSADWLPEGVSRAIDEIRERHVRLVEEAQEHLDTIVGACASPSPRRAPRSTCMGSIAETRAG